VCCIKREEEKVNFDNKRAPNFFVGLCTSTGRKHSCRRLEGLPPESKAPHIKPVYIFEGELYLLPVPIANLLGIPSFAVFDINYFFGVTHGLNSIEV